MNADLVERVAKSALKIDYIEGTAPSWDALEEYQRESYRNQARVFLTLQNAAFRHGFGLPEE